MSGAKSRCMPQAASVALTCGGLEILVEPGARRGERAAAPCRARRRCPSCARPSRRSRPARARHRRAEQPEQMLGLARKGRDEAAPGLGVGGREGGDARGGLLEVGADAEPAPVGKGAGEAIGDRREFQPVRFQFICIFPVEGRAGEEAQIHRAEIVAEAGERVFARSGPRRRSPRCARKPRLSSLSSARCAAHARLLWPAPTSMASNSLTPRPAIPLCLKIIADAYVFV